MRMPGAGARSTSAAEAGCGSAATQARPSSGADGAPSARACASYAMVAESRACGWRASRGRPVHRSIKESWTGTGRSRSCRPTARIQDQGETASLSVLLVGHLAQGPTCIEGKGARDERKKPANPSCSLFQVQLAVIDPREAPQQLLEGGLRGVGPQIALEPLHQVLRTQARRDTHQHEARAR